MLSTADFIHLPYTPDLTRSGIAYACRSLAHTYNRMGGDPFKRLRRIVAGIAVELAFRRHLTASEVPFDTLGATPFTDPDKYDIALGGRKCDVKSYMIFRKERIRLIRRTPEILLNAEAIVPVDQVNSDHLPDDGLYIFGFLTALVTHSLADLARALSGDQPVYLIHPMPENWSHPPHWRTLGNLVMKSDLAKGITLELGGQDASRKFATQTIELPPHTRRPIPGDWHTAGYVASATNPNGSVGIHSPALNETYLIEPRAWGNIWVYGMEIILTGYISGGEFRRKGRRIPEGTPVFQYPLTRTENIALPMRELHPLHDLFDRAKAWPQKKMK